MNANDSGTVEVLGYELFFRTFGDGTDRPVVLGLHGGPGACHDYLLPLGDLAQDGYRVVLFDQLGCGRSEVPTGDALFTLDHHVAEVEGIRAALGLGKVHLVGSSYGGLLAIAYALQHSDQVRSMTTVGGLASVPLTQREMDRLLDELPEVARRAIARYGAASQLDHPDYLAAVQEFYHRHLCRLETWPPELTYTLEQISNHPVYGIMNGPNEFTISGRIKNVDLSGELHRVRAPTLVLGGRYDEVTPTVARQIHEGIAGSRSVTFENSSHLPFWEEREQFRVILSSFLKSVDGASGR